MTRRIFLSYRREDEPGFALALFGRLEQAFPPEDLFMDVEGGIAAGEDFVRVLEDQVSACDVLLALIGPKWLTAMDEMGHRSLDNPRDFETPVAWYEDRSGDFELVAKFAGHLWSARIDHSPLDVVAWHGNHAPYRYDLRRFNTIGSISYDHPDPSIFLVLQSVSDTPGVDSLDFVIFPPRWLVMENTFRPPWFHRNVASEFMGLIEGVYDAKAEGFSPGAASLHNCMSGHGPDAATWEKATRADTSTPAALTGTMAFMFETRSVIRPTRYALESPLLQRDYAHVWQELRRHFAPPAAAAASRAVAGAAVAPGKSSSGRSSGRPRARKRSPR